MQNPTVKTRSTPARIRSHSTAAATSAWISSGCTAWTCGMYSKSPSRFDTPAVRPK